MTERCGVESLLWSAMHLEARCSLSCWFPEIMSSVGRPASRSSWIHLSLASSKSRHHATPASSLISKSAIISAECNRCPSSMSSCTRLSRSAISVSQVRCISGQFRFLYATQCRNIREDASSIAQEGVKSQVFSKVKSQDPQISDFDAACHRDAPWRPSDLRGPAHRPAELQRRAPAGLAQAPDSGRDHGPVPDARLVPPQDHDQAQRLQGSRGQGHARIQDVCQGRHGRPDSA